MVRHKGSRRSCAATADDPVRDAPDSISLDFAEHSDLTGRLRGLVIMLGEGVSLDQARSTDELIDRSEFEAALEALPEQLAEQQTPIPDPIRDDFERLS